jgi:pyridoxine 4-dehydrogenase
MVQACSETLSRINKPVLDIAQLHWPPPLGWQESAYFAGLASLKNAGTVREIGLSNYGPRGVRRAHVALAKQGVALASNQVQFSLVSRLPLESGLLDVCSELNVRPIAYSPLGLGLLTGKYSLEKNNLPPGPRGFLFKSLLPSLQPLLSALRDIGASRSKSCSQVAINWTICKGAVPIVGVKNAAQAKENLGALGWRLSSSEVAQLDAAAAMMRGQAQQNIFQTD